jgi:prepilin-type N-terminal cleavage/methylation domain-containing protein
MTTKRKGTSAFTMVELMIVVMIIGVLAAVAIPAFSRYIKKSRTPEQAQLLNKLWLGSITYYQIDHMDSASIVMPKQFPGVSGAKEQTVECGCYYPGNKCPGGASIWTTDGVWVALSISMADPHSYMPMYTGTGTGTAALFTASAMGDLNCNGTLSSYTRKGAIVNGEVTGNTAPYIVNDGE